MPPTATGRFDVTLTPNSTPDPHEGSDLGRLDLSKTFEGDLVGASAGQMLTAMSKVDGSAGYVAIERFTGNLHGRPGTFVLQHSGSMNRGAPDLTIRVVPDSGTGELRGLTGSMEIQIVEGEHSYRFEYSLDGGSGVASGAEDISRLAGPGGAEQDTDGR